MKEEKFGDSRDCVLPNGLVKNPSYKIEMSSSKSHSLDIDN